MPNKGRGSNQKKFDWLSGGVATYPDSHQVEMLSKGRLYLTDGQNIDYNKPGAWTKRQGFEIVGAALESNLFESQATQSATLAVTAQASNTLVICQKITAPSTASIAAVNTSFAVPSTSPNAQQFTSLRAVWRVDSAGSPGNLVSATAISETLIDGFEQKPYLGFPIPPTLTSGTDYWLCFEATVGSGISGSPQATVSGVSSSGTVKYGATGYTGLLTATFNIFRYIYVASLPIQGLYDYKVSDSSGTTQFPIGACAGNVRYYNGAAWSSSIKTGLSTGQNNLYDFETMKNMLFLCDNAVTSNQIWDGAVAAMSPHGYRGTFSIAQSASAGGPWSAAGVVQVMLVTQLISGGYRASAVSSITLGATTNKIDLSSIAVDAVAAQFGFDIAATATTIYCTLPNGSIFYKVPAASLSTAGNPIANTQTSNSILPMTDATLIAGGSIETNLRLPTGYFTSQVNTPKAKYLTVFQDFLCMAGDPDNLSSVWISEQYAPQIWSTYGKSYGVRLDINTDDGEIVTGLAVVDGALLVGKQHNIFRVDYTGDFNDPFRVRRVHGQIGVLSHFTMQVIPDGMFFLSERGPAICYGNYSRLIEQTSLIQNKFDNLDSARFELSAMRYATACNDTSRNQVMMTTSSQGSTIRDGILVYNYKDQSFMFWRGPYTNYMTTITDTSNFPVVWGGDYSAQVFMRDNGYNDNTIPSQFAYSYINFRAVTPDLDFGEPTYYKEGVFLEIAGERRTNASNAVVIDVFLDKSSTARTTLVWDPTLATFQTGISKAVPGKFKTIRLRVRNTSLLGDLNEGFQLYWMNFTYSLEGVRV
jgi:hypothetical protein